MNDITVYLLMLDFHTMALLGNIKEHDYIN